MAVTSAETRAAKEKWLLRPVYWAENVVFFSFVYGAVYYWFGFLEDRTLIICLVIALGIASALLFWAHARIMNAARGRG